MSAVATPPSLDDLSAYCLDLAQSARRSSRVLATVRGEKKNRWLRDAALALEDHIAAILASNESDLGAAAAAGLAAAQMDRLRLTPDRIHSMSKGLREVAELPDPVGQIRESRIRPNGLEVHKVGVPLGVILFIFESRPNVTVDAAGLCIKSGNALILRGGREAIHTNVCLHRVLQESLRANDLPVEALQLVATTDREAVGRLLRLACWIDLVIPRGGEGLIRRVAEEARMPVLKHYKGNCHVYIHKDADLVTGERIVVNAKCQRPGVCNAAESVVVDAAVAGNFLPRLGSALREHKVQMRGCSRTCEFIRDAVPATEDDYGAEYLDLIVSIKVVDGLEEAIDHINRYGSGHTEAIVTRDLNAARRFTAVVDSSCVLVNASTRFNDGQELGLGAEIGISTDKFHARGPCGLLELTSYKYIVLGQGQLRG